jgi:choline dehydrogenase-like flavoprotein
MDRTIQRSGSGGVTDTRDTAMADAQIDESKEWDAIVIGSGVGGATVARYLAQQGLEVLILEKGKRVSAAMDQVECTTPAERVARGWWPMPISEKKPDGTYARFFAPVGCAVGGSSIHYAAALERMAASDFQALNTKNGGTAVWPITYEELVPFYEAAEKLYRVKTQLDAAAASRLSDWDKAMMHNLRRNGLQPELLHVAIDYDERCVECTGKICPRGCKADAMSVCIADALRQPSCRLLESCDVQSLEADPDRVRTVRAIHEGRQVSLKARVVVLCAGAFQSPVILLKSANEVWPDGLANRSGQVGRNLMFHTSDVLAVWAPRRFDRVGRQKKSISMRDFYLQQGARLGYIQSMGIDIGRGAIAVHLKNMLRRVGVRSELLLSALVKLPSHLAAAVLGNASVFAAATEDDADPENRVCLDPGEPNGAHFVYTITEDLRRRAGALRNAFKAAIRPWRLVPLSPALAMNYGHPCGTCRFGDDARSNVLDRNCKAHGLANLFVVDSSFMPRSGAVNPSLTIAANALRVAPLIAACARI